MPRNCRFSSRIRPSETKAIVADARALPIAVERLRRKRASASVSIFSLRWRLTTSIIDLDLALLGLFFVSLDDHLHELVTHDVFFGEVDKLDAFEIGEHAFRFNQAAAFSGRQIHLSDVAGDHRL